MSDDSGDVRDLLRAAADGPPPVRIDVSAVLAEGDRVVRRHRVGRALAVVATSVAVAGAVTGVPLLRPDRPGTQAVTPAQPPAGADGSSAPTGSHAHVGPTRSLPPPPTRSPRTSGDVPDRGNRMTLALRGVLALPAAHLTGVGGQPPLTFSPIDGGYMAQADISDHDGQGNITVVVKPMTTSTVSKDPCDGQIGSCVSTTWKGAHIAVVDTPVGQGAHRWKVVAWRPDYTVVAVEGTNWSEQERLSKHVDPTTIVRRNDSPLTENQMIRAATEDGLFWN